MSKETYSRALDKPLVWLKGEVKTPPFSTTARVETGGLLRRLQRGGKLALPQSRPMPSIGPACHELRIRDANRSWRVVYFVDSEAIVILEVFAKSTRLTPAPIIGACRRRLARFGSDG